MSGSNGTVNRVKGPSTLVRPRFEPGMLLQHDDLEQMTTYTRDLNRLMFRSLFGCGVVCGLVVTTKRDCGKDTIVVGAGVAIDGSGDPIYVPRDQPLVIDEHCDNTIGTQLWVVLCRTAKGCAPRTAMCPSDEDETSSVCSRERDGYEIRIVRALPKCACQCELPTKARAPFDSMCWCVDPTDPCYEDHYAGICGCGCDDCAGGSCDCECVLLAQLDHDDLEAAWTADHRVRRFVRPVLMRDPQVELERQASQTSLASSQAAATAAPAPVTPATAGSVAKGAMSKRSRKRGNQVTEFAEPWTEEGDG